MRRLTLILVIVLLSSCRTFEIGFVQTPSTTAAPALRATATSMATISTSTVAPTYTATALPTSTATLTPTATARPIVIRPTRPIAQAPTATALPLPRILSFTVEPLVVDPGDSVTLRWETTGTEYVNVYQYTPDSQPFSYDMFNLPASGQITQTIPVQQRLWRTFMLSLGGADFVTQKVHVLIRCPYIYFFSPLPIEDREDWACPDGSAISSSAAEQVFESGRMIWLEHDDVIYVFFNDGKYRTFENTWVAGQPETAPGLTPPQGRFAPVRGFGKVWSGDEEVRSRLGWALAVEQGFETQIQGGWIRCCSPLDSVNRPIYLRNIAGRIIRLWPGEMPPGQWSFVTP